MWNTPSKEELAKIPKLYETENIPLEDKIIYMHFFVGGSDWFIAEYDGKDIFFGFAVLNSDYMNAEWGYAPFSELKEINIKGIQIDRDLFWEARKTSEVELIKKCGGF